MDSLPSESRVFYVTRSVRLRGLSQLYVPLWPTMMTRVRRLFAACLAIAIGSAALPSPVFAQADQNSGVIQITVKNDDGSAALSNARVFLLGPSVASALTTRSGIVKYTDVSSGIYRVRISKPGYRTSTSSAFELLGNKEVDVSVSLGLITSSPNLQTGSSDSSADGLKVIGRVVSRVQVSTHDVDENSAIRRISDSLTDALNTVAGVDVTQSSNDPDSPQTISLHGHDESQTAVTLDGIPLSAPGTAANLRGINTDLFTGAGASFGARAGALGGGVNFTTLQPTQTWQYRGSAADGSFDKYNWSLGATGSVGKLGIAVLTTKRGGNNQLTFQDYEDQSGITYAHGGESTSAGEYIKLRYGLTDNTTLTFTALQNNTDTQTLCTHDTGPLPCGIGPGNNSTGKFQFVYGTIQSLVGQVAVQATGYVNSQYNLSNQIDRYIDNCVGQPVSCPTAEPFATDTYSITRGIAAQATISKDNHTITLNATTFGAQTSFVPLVVTGTSTFVVPSLNDVSADTYALADSIKVSNRVTVGPTLSLAATTGAGTSILGGFSGDWRPNDNDDISFSASIGSSQPAPQVVRSFSDPQSANVNCPGGTAQISGPGDQPTAQSAIDYEVGWTHQWKYGNFSTDLYRQSQAGQLVNATVTAQAGNVPSFIYQAVQGYYQQVCPLSTLPASVYVSEPVNNTDRLYQGYDISGRLALGKDVTLLPSYSTNSSIYLSADPLYTGTGSTLILNSQLYGRPLHKGNVTIDAYHPPSGIELLANAQYVGVNNSQHIAPYVNVSFGISHPFGIGMLTLFETNAFNTETALFSTINGAYPEPLVGGGELLVAGNPLPPRTIQLSYTFNTGARPGAGFAHVPGMRGGAGRQVAQAGASPAPDAARGPGLGFGELHFVPPPDGTNPLSLATSRTECTAELQPLATAALAQLGAAAAAYAAGATTLPVIAGISVTPHGEPTGAWYFALGPDIPRGLFQRPENAGGGGRRPPGPPGEGGPGGFGGGAPGFRPQVSVAPNTSEPRPAFTPSPELIAALLPFRALVSCAYASVLTPDEAKTRGFDIQPPGGPRPAASSSPAPAPNASPDTVRRRANPRGAGFVNYAPSPGLFVVRAPDLGTGGGSVKQAQ
jgi:hypothetical protein